jgi:hypothetical protein
VRQATGYTVHLAYFAPSAPHLRKGAGGYRTINEKLDELCLAVQKICRRLLGEGRLSNAALTPLLTAAVGCPLSLLRTATPTKTRSATSPGKSCKRFEALAEQVGIYLFPQSGRHHGQAGNDGVGVERAGAEELEPGVVAVWYYVVLAQLSSRLRIC